MCVVARAAAAWEYCSNEVRDRIIETVKCFGLPTETVYDAQALFASALSDKKRCGSYLDLIVPAQIGDCRIIPMELDKFQSFLQAGLS